MQTRVPSTRCVGHYDEVALERQALGAKVIITPAADRGSGMVKKAEELAKEHGWFLPCQLENEANAWIHSETTAPEILEAMGGVGIDHFVSAYGTGGTLKGVARDVIAL